LSFYLFNFFGGGEGGDKNMLMVTGTDRAATISEMHSPADLNMKLIIHMAFLIMYTLY
jgi:hypothetical protein